MFRHDQGTDLPENAGRHGPADRTGRLTASRDGDGPALRGADSGRVGGTVPDRAGPRRPGA
ncbi:MAG: hypothetical protein JWM15_1396, partial [Cryptosporangiaceae bacterium]|nr:hypothetical protein [Cryptosporangiaceae bacterium]